jgi:hypothetical protein
MAQKSVCAESAEKAGIAPPGFSMRFRPGAGPQPALPPIPGDAAAGVSLASARDNVPGGRPISGSLVKVYSTSMTTRAGHQVYGTEAGLACLKPARGQMDRNAELFELVCPAAALGCYLTAPDATTRILAVARAACPIRSACRAGRLTMAPPSYGFHCLERCRCS